MGKASGHLPKAVFFFGVFHFEAADAGVGPAAVGHHQGDDDFIGPWSVVDANGHGVEVGSHKGGILIVGGYIDSR